ncbi:MAG: tetratricopeptide repeat protein [Vulcanimicrobiaceae bacterium]
MTAQIETVLESLEAIVAESPHAVSFLFERARVLEALGRDALAEEAYRAVLLEDRSHFRALNDLGRLYHRNKLIKEAEVCFRAAVAVDPHSVVGATNLGYVLFGRGDLQGAELEFNRALALHPDHAPAIRGLTGVLRGLGGDPRHLQVTQAEAPKLMPQVSAADAYVEYVYEVAANTILAGETDSVRSFLEKLLGRDPANVRLLWRLADFASRQHNHQAALQIYQHAAAIEPENRELHLGIASAYEEMGNGEAASAVWSSDVLRGVVRIFEYKGTHEPVRLLTVASALHAIRYELLVDYSRVRNTVIYTQAYADAYPLPEHDAVFIAIGDVESDSAALAVAKRIVARTNAPVINRPESVAHTGRLEQSMRLGLLEGVRTSHIVPVSRERLCQADSDVLVRDLGFEFPMLLRSPGFHNGFFFEPVDRPDQLRAVASQLLGDEVFLISFEDTRSADGMMRKYRVMCIDGVLYPIHLAVSPKWKVHYASSQMHESARFRAEEAKFLSDPSSVVGARAMHALESIAKAMDLDYGGIDFGIDANGNVVVFEANGAMGIFMPDDDPRWDYRRSAFSAALDAAKNMIVRRATPTSPQPER